MNTTTDAIAIDDFIREFDVQADSTLDVHGWSDREDLTGMPEGSQHYRVVLTRRESGKARRRMTVDYSMGPAHCREPEAAEVIESLVLDASSVYYGQDFRSFCEDFALPFEADYDDVTPKDVQRSRAIFRACQRNAEKLGRWLPEGVTLTV